MTRDETGYNIQRRNRGQCRETKHGRPSKVASMRAGGCGSGPLSVRRGYNKLPLLELLAGIHGSSDAFSGDRPRSPSQSSRHAFQSKALTYLVSAVRVRLSAFVSCSLSGVPCTWDTPKNAGSYFIIFSQRRGRTGTAAQRAGLPFRDGGVHGHAVGGGAGISCLLRVSSFPCCRCPSATHERGLTDVSLLSVVYPNIRRPNSTCTTMRTFPSKPQEGICRTSMCR